jgi:formylmethanofuran dehydrogenase subunit C
LTENGSVVVKGKAKTFVGHQEEGQKEENKRQLMMR